MLADKTSDTAVQVIRRKPWLARHGFGAGVFIVLLIDFLLNAQALDTTWMGAWYAMAYDVGFGSRLLVGSLLLWICQGYVSARAAQCFVTIALIVMMLLVAWVCDMLVGKALKGAPVSESNMQASARVDVQTSAWASARADAQTSAQTCTQTSAAARKRGFVTAGILTLWIVCPAGPHYLWTGTNTGRFDTYVFMLSLVAILVFLLCHRSWVKLVWWTVLSALAVLIYQGFVFIYYPVILLCMALELYHRYVAGERLRGYVLGAILSLVVVCALFFLVQFAGSLNFADAQSLAAFLATRTNIPIEVEALHYEYYAGVGTAMREIAAEYYPGLAWKGVLILVAMSPLLVLVVAFWRSARLATRNSNGAACSTASTQHSAERLATSTRGRADWYMRAIALVLLLLYVPIYVVGVDWGRWSGALFTYLLLALALLLASDTAGFGLASERCFDWFLQHWWVALILFAFMAALPAFSAGTGFDGGACYDQLLKDLSWWTSSLLG